MRCCRSLLQDEELQRDHELRFHVSRIGRLMRRDDKRVGDVLTSFVTYDIASLGASYICRVRSVNAHIRLQ